MLEPVLDHVDSRLESFEDVLRDLIRIPSVSADPAHARDVRRSANAFADVLGRAGMEKIDILDVDGAHPIVCGEWMHREGAPSMLIYGHHDVQPPGRSSEWLSPPYEPVERDGRLYGRGSADDKGGILAQIAAVACLLESAGALPCNVRFLIEGEEEIGSPNLPRYLAAYPERARADFVVLCDTPNFATGVPALTYRLRGNCLVDVTVRCLERPLHSGRGGGAVPDPLRILCELIAALRDVEFAGVAPPEARELAAVRALGTDAFHHPALLPGVELLTNSPLERTWLHPSITVTALDATPVAQASNQIAASARARISIRTVPDMDTRRTGERVAELLRDRAPRGVIVETTVLGGPTWWKGDRDSRAYAAALRAMSRGYGRQAVLIGSGGSIGFVRPMADALPNAPCLLMGVEDPPCNAHSENESLHLGDWRSAIRAAVFLQDELSR